MKTIRKEVFFSLLLLVSAGNVEAAENEMENWYTYWGLGISRVTWPDEDLNAAVKLLAALPGVSRTQLSLDLLGFYKPINPNTMVGFIANGAADRLEISEEGDLQVNLTTYAASAQYFPEKIGQGIFGRADIGLALGNVQVDGESETSDPGFGLLVGVGYAHPIMDGTRLALNVNYAIRQIEGETWKTLGISIGGLF